MARAATETQKAGLTGLEFGLAIPGTVGGRGLGATPGPTARTSPGVLESADVLSADGIGAEVRPPSSAFAYRDSRFKHPAAPGDRPS